MSASSGRTVDTPAQIESADVRQIHVHQDELWAHVLKHAPGIRPAIRIDDGIPGALQHAPPRIPPWFLIVDVEDRGHLCGHTNAPLVVQRTTFKIRHVDG